MAALAPVATGMNDPSADFAALLARLQARATQAGAARAEELRLERRDPARRWRRANLLWPLFNQG